ncbi:MAG TPA: hypothetical protein VK034_17730 [Enhygromyxa sp.]|nr:hypothetical protein [Enhygromyxa sp.]
MSTATSALTEAQMPAWSNLPTHALDEHHCVHLTRLPAHVELDFDARRTKSRTGPAAGGASRLRCEPSRPREIIDFA